MTVIALFGAGGKMGCCLSKNQLGSRFEVRHVEVSDAGKARLATEIGITAMIADEALTGANVVIFAVPDTAIGKVATGILSEIEKGAMVIVLDAAAPFTRTRRSHLFCDTSLLSANL